MFVGTLIIIVIVVSFTQQDEQVRDHFLGELTVNMRSMAGCAYIKYTAYFALCVAVTDFSNCKDSVLNCRLLQHSR